MDPIRTVIFGQGFARNVMLPCLRHVDGIEVVGLASPNLDKLKETAERFAISALDSDHRAILERTRPDLAIVATPPHRHAEQAIDALEAGCHVLCEKPMALDSEETGRMAAAARRRPGRLALIDHELRFLPTHLRLRERVRAGELGRIRAAASLLASPGRRDPSLPWNWWSEVACGGGALGAIGSHAVDALRWILGEVVQVRGRLETVIPERFDPATGAVRAVTSDDRASARLRFASGAVARIEISLVEAERAHLLAIRGDAAWARVEEQRPLCTTRLPAPRPDDADRDDLGWTDGLVEAWRAGPAADGEEEEVKEDLDQDLPPSSELGIPDTDWARAFLRMMRRAVVAIDHGTELEGAAGFEEGHRTQKVLDAIRRAARSSAWEEVGSA